MYFYLEKSSSVLTGFYTFFAKNTMLPLSTILQKMDKCIICLFKKSTASILKLNY